MIFTAAVNKPSFSTEARTWFTAAEVCRKVDGHLLSDEEYIFNNKERVVSEMNAHNISEAWYGKYFTQWVWIKGIAFLLQSCVRKYTGAKFLLVVYKSQSMIRIKESTC